MKKSYLLIVFMCLSVFYTYGQNKSFSESPHLGIKIGTNYSNVYDTEGEEFRADGKFGFATGLFLSLPIGKLLGFQPEILFSQRGFKSEGSILTVPYEISRTSNYIDVPLLIMVRPSKYFSILAGPQYSYLIKQTNKFESSITNIELEEQFDNEDIRKNTLCFTGGLDFNVENIVIGTRVGWDLLKNNGDGTTTALRYKNVWYQLTVGIKF
ncbi:MAG: PorT family protein [Bacteroidales bacterium]|nr:PorT family protein [Bacteroidales bacterium]